MQADRFTIKSQEALQAAIAVAAAHEPHRDAARAPARRADRSARERRRARPAQARRRAGRDPPADDRPSRDLPDDHRRRQGAVHQPRADGRPAPGRARGGQAQRRVHLDRAHPARVPASQAGEVARILDSQRRQPQEHARGDRAGPRPAPGHRPEPRGQVPVAAEVRARPHAGRRGRQARPGHRPRRRDPPRDPGPLPPHQEQPRPDRRARRRQDRDRRGPRPAHRLRRHPRVACATARSSASTSAPCWPAPSTAASSRSA